MSAAIHTIVIIGGTSGIGSAFLERFHGMGKKVIVTGRRKDRLEALKKSHAGVDIYEMDMAELERLPGHVETLFNRWPEIDTVWVNGGVQRVSFIKDPSSTTDARVIQEITVNTTAPILLGRHVIPRLVNKGTETNFMITSSGLGFAPMGSMFPVYCPTKAAIHAYLVGVRQALKDTNVNVLELAPPFVGDTELADEFADLVRNAPKMALKEFTDESFKIMDSTPVKDLKEITAGSGIPRVEAWRSGVGKMLAESGLGG